MKLEASNGSGITGAFTSLVHDYRKSCQMTALNILLLPT